MNQQYLAGVDARYRTYDASWRMPQRQLKAKNDVKTREFHYAPIRKIPTTSAEVQ